MRSYILHNVHRFFKSSQVKRFHLLSIYWLRFGTYSWKSFSETTSEARFRVIIHIFRPRYILLFRLVGDLFSCLLNILAQIDCSKIDFPSLWQQLFPRSSREETSFWSASILFINLSQSVSWWRWLLLLKLQWMHKAVVLIIVVLVKFANHGSLYVIICNFLRTLQHGRWCFSIKSCGFLHLIFSFGRRTQKWVQLEC